MNLLSWMLPHKTQHHRHRTARLLEIVCRIYWSKRRRIKVLGPRVTRFLRKLTKIIRFGAIWIRIQVCVKMKSVLKTEILRQCYLTNQILNQSFSAACVKNILNSEPMLIIVIAVPGDMIPWKGLKFLPGLHSKRRKESKKQEWPARSNLPTYQGQKANYRQPANVAHRNLVHHHPNRLRI